MSRRDPIEAVLDAIVSYFENRVSQLQAVRKGFPEHVQDLDLEQGPVLSVSLVGEPDTNLCTPRTVDVTDTHHTYRVGFLFLTVQLDLWSAYKAQREDIGWEVDDTLHNKLPATTGLWIDSDEYYCRPIIANVVGGRFEDGAESAPRGEWRRTWDLLVETDLVREIEGVKQSQIDIELETTLNEQVVTETKIVT